MKTPQHLSPFDSKAIVQVMSEAVADAIETHRRLKQPVVQAHNNRIVWIRPEDIAPRPLPGDDEPLPEDSQI